MPPSISRVPSSVVCLFGLLIGGIGGYWHRGADPPTTGSFNAPQAPPSLAQRDSISPASAQRIERLEKMAQATEEELIEMSRRLLSADPGEVDQIEITMLFARWIEVNPSRGLQLLLKGEFGAKNPSQIAWGYLGRWSAVDPEAAINHVPSLKFEYDRTVACSRISQQLASQRPHDFFRFYKEISAEGGDTSHFAAEAALNLATKDPEAAKALVQEIETGVKPGLKRSLTDLCKKVALGLAEQDLDGALVWCRNETDEAQRASGLAGIAEAISASNPKLAAELAIESERTAQAGNKERRNPAVNSLAESIALRWAQTDMKAAITWIRTHFPDQNRNSIGQMLRESLPRDPRLAIEIMTQNADIMFDGENAKIQPSDWMPTNVAEGLALSQQVTDPKQAAALTLVFLRALARQDPAQALAMAEERIPTPANRSTIFRQAMQHWASSDLTAASAWLSKREPSSQRDQAIQGLLEVVNVIEPDSALHWSASLSTSKDRIDATARSLRALGVKGAAEASDKIIDLQLSTTERESITRSFHSP